MGYKTECCATCHFFEVEDDDVDPYDPDDRDRTGWCKANKVRLEVDCNGRGRCELYENIPPEKPKKPRRTTHNFLERDEDGNEL